jgi:hypothetical protein
MNQIESRLHLVVIVAAKTQCGGRDAQEMLLAMALREAMNL